MTAGAIYQRPRLTATGAPIAQASAVRQDAYMRAVMLTILCLAAVMSGCLFNGDPECFPGEEAERCRAGEVCVDRVCVPDPTASDMASPQRDGTPPDMASDAPCQPAIETCNGLDDDCDLRIDEAVDSCTTYPTRCGWIERARHVYLVCPEPVSQDGANQLCAAVGDMQLAFTESCEEADWLGLSAQEVARAFDAFFDDDPRSSTRGWWIDLRFREPGDETTFFRFGQGAIGAIRCWNRDEPNNLHPDGEPCINLLASVDGGAEYSYGWNDDRCVANPENRVGTICEFPCAPGRDADRDGIDACADCDDGDPDAPGDSAIDNCPPPLFEFDRDAQGMPRP